jgi:hypothetical protein
MISIFLVFAIISVFTNSLAFYAWSTNGNFNGFVKIGFLFLTIFNVFIIILAIQPYINNGTIRLV